MLKWLNDLIKRNDATTPCQALPGDIYHLRYEGPLGTYEFEWDITKPYKTWEDAKIACIDTLDLIQTRDEI